MERAGTIKEVQVPEEGTKQPFKYVITTDDGRELKITAWPDSGAAGLEVGQQGVFTGDSKQESYNDKTFTRFYATRFDAAGQPSSSGASPQGSSSVAKDASFALSYAKDLCVGFVAIGHFKDEKELMASWGNLADFALEWLKQNA